MNALEKRGSLNHVVSPPSQAPSALPSQAPTGTFVSPPHFVTLTRSLYYIAGDVLAGRPHGLGQFYVPAGSGMRLQYDGEWVSGFREGHGSQLYWTGEAYHGELVQNKRHGHGRMEYKCGDVYEGQWVRDRKHGMGTHFFANGDCFVGYFASDKRQGLGTMYWLSRGKKYAGEWSADRPQVCVCMPCPQSRVAVCGSFQALKGEPPARETASKTDVVILSWPHNASSAPWSSILSISDGALSAWHKMVQY